MDIHMTPNKLLQKILNKYSFSGKSSFELRNPATDELICSLEEKSADYTQKAIAKSKDAQAIFKNTSSKSKSELLYRWYSLMMQHFDVIAEIITIESGKPLAESKGELQYGANFIKWYAEKANRIDGRVFDPNLENMEGRVDYQPVGVVAAITPWNFPFAMITRKVAPAIAAGCSVVLKPSELTPLSAFVCKELFVEAGGDEDLLQIVCGDSKTIGKEFMESKLVRKITFTGSTRVGKLLMQQAADTVKKVSLELGGNAPFIVFENADIVKAIIGLISAKIRNAGQVCIAPNRVFVAKSIKEIFMTKLTSAVSELKLGNGLDDGVKIGPLINDSAVKKVQSHIDDAISKGAKLVYGGEIDEKLGGKFFKPTIIDNVTDEMLVSCDETFGPLIAIFEFDNEAEVIERANNTNYGLASYFFSEDMAQIRRVRSQLEYGMIGINTGVISSEKAPFGGMKESGLGREGSDDGIYEFMEAKYSLQKFS
jgi:succinate-semialdehyde dehydrogenase/glutarate-semialdehyde dehydrogenase